MECFGDSPARMVGPISNPAILLGKKGLVGKKGSCGLPLSHAFQAPFIAHMRNANPKFPTEIL